jgi:AbrB family looped-hinge helix DNA binding protein
MRTTIDSAGRVVVPKGVRDEVGLRPGQEIEVTARDGRVEIEPAATPMRLVRRRGRLVAEADSSLPPLTAEDVRDSLDDVRR